MAWSHAAIADYFMVNRTTVWRWMTGNQEISGPALRLLLFSMEHLNDVERHMATIKKAREVGQDPTGTEIAGTSDVPDAGI